MEYWCQIGEDVGAERSLLWLCDAVAFECRHFLAQGICQKVGNEGCTDAPALLLADADLPLTVLSHERNRGKGIALRTGLAFARRSFFASSMQVMYTGE